jgi:hypothetical protein
MKFYQKLNVSILSEIQKEVLDFFEKNPDLIDVNATREYFVQMNFDNFPLLKSFIIPRTITTVVETSVCFLPGNNKLRIHIDGLKKDNGRVPNGVAIANQFVLIIPISNTLESINYWYDNNMVEDKDEYIVNRVRPEPPYDFYVSFANDNLDLKPVENTIIDKMTFIRSNIYHNVENKSNDTRIVFIIRFHEKSNFLELDSIFSFRDLT